MSTAGPNDVPKPSSQQEQPQVPGHFISREHAWDTARFLDEVKAQIRHRSARDREPRLGDGGPPPATP